MYVCHLRPSCAFAAPVAAAYARSLHMMVHQLDTLPDLLSSRDHRPSSRRPCAPRQHARRARHHASSVPARVGARRSASNACSLPAVSAVRACVRAFVCVCVHACVAGGHVCAWGLVVGWHLRAPWVMTDCRHPRPCASYKSFNPLCMGRRTGRYGRPCPLAEGAVSLDGMGPSGPLATRGWVSEAGHAGYAG